MSNKTELDKAWECADEWRDKSQQLTNVVERQKKKIQALTDAAHMWMIHHSDRCRACSLETSTALGLSVEDSVEKEQ